MRHNHTTDAWGELVPSGDQVTADDSLAASYDDELERANEEGRWASVSEAAARSGLHPLQLEEAVRDGSLLGGTDVYGRIKVARSEFGRDGQANLLRRAQRGYRDDQGSVLRG